LVQIRPVPIIAAVLLVVTAAFAQDKPNLLPERDVDITYRATTISEKPIKQRVRWLAVNHMQRIDGPGGAVSIANRTTAYITILNSRTKTYVKLEEASDGPFKVDPTASFVQGSKSAVANLPCTEWSWVDASTQKPRMLCVTDDGVMLRMTEDGHVLFEATNVTYRRANPHTFEVPSDYQPTLVPDNSFE